MIEDDVEFGVLEEWCSKEEWMVDKEDLRS